ncbi:hypothetical protein GPECTOR_62g904 [Gonium pectorale]|uniref:Nucleotide-diphospho-sugar transferase domain-containing protein n=1 Tax=Gonium pectorale TaxID=33097 RepID=A0A150G4H7_GONPE|nr:hypothetical protein GPECTOR_62g904 [Gonium pectorale]|eukprot:KXZ44789.1 hypothetical protein GPECTOR_62g904 [Gonium pectorale]
MVIILTGDVHHDIVNTFYDSVRNVNVTSFLSVCTDDASLKQLAAAGLPPCVRVTPLIAVKAWAYGSAVRYQIVREMVKLSYAVLSVDYDMVFFRDPFTRLQRDTDIETMTDAVTHDFARGTQRGADVFSEHHGMWSQPTQFRVMQLNCGCTFFRPTNATLDFLTRFVEALAVSVVWDQALFTELLLQPAYQARGPAGVTLRVMDVEWWANSHVFMNLLNTWFEHVPVVVHANYHKAHVKAWFLMQVYKRYNEPSHPVVSRQTQFARRLLRALGDGA